MKHPCIPRLPWIPLTLAAALAFAPAPKAEAQATIVPGTTITVTTTYDGNILTLPGQPLPCRLRDAIQAANTNLAVAGCPAGKRARLVSASPLKVEDVDQIVFNVGTGTPDILLKNGLPPITDSVTIDGATGGATRIEISGENTWSFFGPIEGLIVTGSFTTLKSLVVNGFSGSGIVLTIPDEDGDGLITVTPALPERPDEIPGGSIDPCGPYAFPVDPSQCPPPGGSPDDNVGSIGTTGGGSNTVVDCLVGVNAAGNAAVPNGTGLPDSGGVVVLTSGNVIGGADPKLGNVISGNHGHGLLLDGRNNLVVNNKIGTGLSTNLGLGNDLDGIFVAGGRFANASCEILGNVIFYNRDDGVDAGYNLCTILANRISSNGALGIDRAGDGVTPNDAGGRMFRRPPNFPEIRKVTTSFTPLAKTTITGVIDQQSPSPVTLEFFYSSSCDPSGYGEGATYLGSKQVAGGSSSSPAPFTFSMNQVMIAGYYTVTATTEQGTSELSACYR